MCFKKVLNAGLNKSVCNLICKCVMQILFAGGSYDSKPHRFSNRRPQQTSSQDLK